MSSFAEAPVDVIISTSREAMHLAPIVHALRFELLQSVRVIACPSLERDLEMLLHGLNLVPDYQWKIHGSSQNPSLLLGEIQLLLGELWNSRKPSYFLSFGHSPLAFSSICSAFQNSISTAHVIDASGKRVAGHLIAHHQQLKKSINSMTDLHFTPNNQIKNRLIIEGIREDDVYTVGSTIADACHLLEGSHIFNTRTESILNSISQAKEGDPGFKPLITFVIEDLNLLSEISDEFLYIFSKTLPPNRIALIAYPTEEKSGNEKPVLSGQVSYLRNLTHMQKVAVLKGSACVVSDSIEALEEGMAFGTPGVLLQAETDRPDLICSGWITIAKGMGMHLAESCIAVMRKFRKNQNPKFPRSNQTPINTNSSLKIAHALTSRKGEISKISRTSLPLQRAQ